MTHTYEHTDGGSSFTATITIWLDEDGELDWQIDSLAARRGGRPVHPDDVDVLRADLYCRRIPEFSAWLADRLREYQEMV